MNLSLPAFIAFPARQHKGIRIGARKRPELERLEDRNLLSITFSNPANMSGDVTLTGTNGGDQFIIRLGEAGSTSGQTIQFSDDNGDHFSTANLAGVTSITVNGLGGGDTLTLDMSNGIIGQAAAALPITFDGGSGGRSTLVVEGGPSQTTGTAEGTPPQTTGTVTEVFNAGANATAGSLTITVAASGGSTGAASAITFTDVKLIQDTLPASSLTVNASDQNSLIVLRNGPDVNGFKTDAIQGINTGGTGERNDGMNGQDDDGNDGNMNMQDDHGDGGKKNGHDDHGDGDDQISKGNGFVTIEFANKTTVNLNGGAGNDQFVLNAPKAATGLNTLNLDGGGGTNFLSDQHTPAGVTLNVTNLPSSLQLNDPDDAFIQDLFLEDLGRVADLDEIAYWRGILNTGGSEAGRMNVVHGIEDSDEGLDMVVGNLYRQYLNRAPVNGEEMFWVNLMKSGETEEQVLAGILGSQEFYNLAQNLISSGTPDERFVQAVYQVLFARTPSQSETSYWINLLATETRTQAAMTFLESQEFRADVVTALFTELLNRPPDQVALNFFLNPSFVVKDIRDGILESTEFADDMGKSS